MAVRSETGDQSKPRRKRLEGGQIRADFGLKGRIAKRAISSLCQAIAASGQSFVARWRATQTLSETARKLLDSGESSPFNRSISSIRAKPAELLFAVQTYFALVVKVLAAYVVLAHRRAESSSRQEPLSCSAEALAKIENGEAFRQVGVGNFPQDDCYGWYAEACGDEIAGSVREMRECLADYDFTAHISSGSLPHELFGDLYASLIPRKLRHSLGEYYTPEWLVDFVLDSVGYDGDPSVRLIDPSCGSGAFLARALGQALSKMSAQTTGSREASSTERRLPSIVGVDVNPLAVLAAKANYIIPLRSLLPFDHCVDIPVHTLDLITGASEEQKTRGPSRVPTELKLGRFDLVVGNPPWVLWDNLSPEYREATKPLWTDYGLFSLSGSKGRMGGGKKDLSMLFVYRSIDRLLKDRGKLGFLITQSVFKTRGAGEGFRRFWFNRHSTWAFINVKSVHDLTALSPFPGASNRTALLICERSDSPTRYPVPYIVWRKKRRDDQVTLFAERASPIDLAERTELLASPIDKDSLGSSWLTVPYGLMGPIRKMIGPSGYKAWEGVNCAGLSGCFIVRIIESLPDGDLVIENIHDIGKIEVKKVSAVIESDLVYPQLLGRDLKRWDARPSAHVILAQDPETRRGIAEETMKAKYPKTLAYLRTFERQLRARAAFKKYFNPKNHPFWSMFNVGTYTLERWRVGWRIMGSNMAAAILPFQNGKPVLPQNTHAFIACETEDEAHYLCAMLNSSLVNFLVRSYSVAGGKSFAPPHIMEYVKIPPYDATTPLHADLVQLSRRCHQAAERGKLELLSAARPALDRLAARSFGISHTGLRLKG